MLAQVGGFGGLFQIDLSKYREPVLVSSIDGVGTKLMIAMMMEKYDTVGHDIVNHCIDDIAVQGAEPLYFMDYIGIGKLRSPLYEEVLTGIADACKAANCAILGGETAEMPGMYGNDFDLVGVITGVVEKSKLITGERIRPGHVAICFGSSGLHTNGFSLAPGRQVDDKLFVLADEFVRVAARTQRNIGDDRVGTNNAGPGGSHDVGMFHVAGGYQCRRQGGEHGSGFPSLFSHLYGPLAGVMVNLCGV